MPRSSRTAPKQSQAKAPKAKPASSLDKPVSPAGDDAEIEFTDEDSEDEDGGGGDEGQETEADKPTDPAAADRAELEQIEKDKYPYLNMGVEAGAAIIDTIVVSVERPMDGNDYAECVEESIVIAQKMREIEGIRNDLAVEEKRAKERLDSVREQCRNARDKYEEHSHHLVELNLSCSTRTRKRETKGVVNITKGLEYVVMDAHDGHVIERRTATIEEIERSRKVRAGCLIPVPPEVIEQANKAYQRTSDSPNAKAAPGDELVIVSVDMGAFDKSKPKFRRELANGPEGGEHEDEKPAWGLKWDQDAGREPGRRYAQVPRSILPELRVLAEAAPRLDFRVEAAKPAA